MWDEIKKALSPFAPVLGGMLGGPLGAAAGVAVKKILTGNEQASNDELMQALQNITPEQRFALQQADNDFNLEMERLALQQYQSEMLDTADARKRQVEMAKQGINWITLMDAITTEVLALINVLGFWIYGGVMFLMVRHDDINTVEATLIGTILGYAISEAKAVNSFKFGSSRGSKQKDVFIETMKK